MAPPVVAWFARAADYLHRRDLRCPQHRIAHTGKLARAIVLDLALLDATGDAAHWQRAAQRAQEVASRLAPDPEHGALVYLPGRLDPRNCSNSIIDSGECTGALATLLAHPRAAALPAGDRALLEHAVERNAETYLVRNVVEKEITNQRLWGAMGLAAACRLDGRVEWRAALDASLRRALADQHADGSWPYHPDPVRHGQHPGAADVSVYYQGRCLAFLIAVLECVPDLASAGDAWDAVSHGLEFLAAVTLPDGLKPLALEGKRWFWDSPSEAGSNAYDVFALVRGAKRFGRPEWAQLAARVWWQLAQHQDRQGAVQAGVPGAADFICPDFHTADVAWTAQVMATLTEPAHEVPPAACEPRVRVFPNAGIVSLSGGTIHALIRTRKQTRNTLYGGAIGGGTLAAVGSGSQRTFGNGGGSPDHDRDRAGYASLDRESAHAPGSFTLYPTRPARLAALRRFLHADAPGREGRQWLFVVRLLLTQRRPLASIRRLWRGYLRPLLEAMSDPIATHYAIRCDGERLSEGIRFDVTPARRDGIVPSWASDVAIERQYHLDSGGLAVQEQLRGGASAARIDYLLPHGARDVQVETSGTVSGSRVGGRRLTLAPGGRAQTLRISYRL